MTIVIAIVMFGVLITIHELGHFVVAKLSKVRVNEFSLGMGPSLFSKTKGETKYSLRLFPIGGYVMMEGEDSESTDPYAFCNVSVYKRIAITIMGSIMNIVLGFLILSFLVLQMNYVPTTIISKFEEGATSSAKLEVNDEIIGVNGKQVFTYNDVVFEIVRDKDYKVDFKVIRNNEKLNISSVAFESLGENQIFLDFKLYSQEKTFLNSAKYTLFWTISTIKQVWGSLVDLVTGNFTLKDLSGPVGVTTAIGKASGMGYASVLMLISFITVNLGVFNLLPLPALDGGRLIFLFVEIIIGKPISPKYEAYIHAGGLFFFFALMLFVTYNDIVRLITG